MSDLGWRQITENNIDKALGMFEKQQKAWEVRTGLKEPVVEAPKKPFLERWEEPPDSYRLITYDDYARLNEDEALDYIYHKATASGWKCFQWFGKKKGNNRIHRFYVFDLEMYIYYFNPPTFEKVIVDIIPLEKVLGDVLFFKAYYGSGFRAFQLYRNEVGEVYRTDACIRDSIWYYQINKIKEWENKVQWLFANIDF